jgi:hypothetical protein
MKKEIMIKIKKEKERRPIDGRPRRCYKGL